MAIKISLKIGESCMSRESSVRDLVNASKQLGDLLSAQISPLGKGGEYMPKFNSLQSEYGRFASPKLQSHLNVRELLGD